MQLAAILRELSAFGALRRTFAVSSSAQKLQPTFGFCSMLSSIYRDSEATESENEETTNRAPEATESLSRRIEQLPSGESVGLAFRSWMGDGYAIQRGDILNTINRLRKFKSHKRALEVMEWVIRERPYKPQELDYSYLLEFTAKVHGVHQGESLFTRIPTEFQNQLLYNNLVLACLNRGLIRLSLAYMRKMRELGYPISYLVFNRLITLHSSPSLRKSIPKILTQMKADKVAPHVSTYNILLKIEANQHNIQGLMKVFDDMRRVNIEPDEISYGIVALAHAAARMYTACEAYVEAMEKSMTGNNWSTLDVLLKLYGYLHKQEQVHRIWDIIQKLPELRSKSFLVAIEAFGMIGDLSRAEELWQEMKCKKGLKSIEQFNSLIAVYCRHGLIKKATGLFKEIDNYEPCKPNALTFRHLALGCLRAGLVKEAIKTLELGDSMSTSTRLRRSTPWLETTFSLIELFAEEGDVENSEKQFEDLKKANYSRYTFVYNALIKAYVKAKKCKANFLKRMILGGARPDSETYSLIKLIDQFR